MIVSLDAIAAEPTRVHSLPREICLDLIAKAAAVQAVLVARFSETTTETEDADDTLSTEQAAALLGVAPKTLANQATGRYKSLRLRNLSRRLAFSRKAILALQADRGLTLGSHGLTLLPALGRKRLGRRPSSLSPRHEEGGATR